MNRKKILITASILIVILGLYGLINYYSNTYKLIVSFKNVNEVSVYSETDGKNNKIKTILESSKGIRLKKGIYIIKYSGSPDYSSGSLEVNVDNEKSVTVDPSYSKEKLADLLKDQSSQINNLLKTQIPKIDLYIVQPGELYMFGDWYGAVLTYNGDDAFNADTLRVVMKKENNTWKLMTNPPEIMVNKKIHKEIPPEIVDLINNTQSQIQSKYTSF